MKGHLSRKEIKRDEVREAMGRGVEYVRSHESLALWIVGGLLGVFLVAALVVYLMGRREEAAGARLAEGLRVYGAGVDVFDPAPDDPERPRFATDQERLEKAEAVFAELADDYGGTDAGQVAKAYLGEIAALQGDADTARELWGEYLRKNEGNVLAVSVELNLLALDREAGRLEEVRTGLERQLEEGASRTLPEDVVLFELAQTLEALGRESEAQDTLQRLVDDHPRSPFVFEARQRLAPRPS